MFRILLLSALLCTGFAAQQARAFDPISSDISGFVLAVALSPEAPRPGASLNLRARHPDGRTLAETFQLRAIERPRRGPQAADFFYALAPRDKPRLAAARSRIATWKSDTPATEGSLAFNLDLAQGSGLRGSLWVSPVAGGAYRMIMEDAPLP